MNVNKVFLAKTAVNKNQYPDDKKTEIAFVGKSNVGKSSLINAMINRKALARTSQNPGKTRTINFYDVEDKLYFVDLPGYGYAKAPKSDVTAWGKMIDNYLLKREELKQIIMLVDSRHPPSENDKMMFEWLCHYGYTVVIAATKIDKLKPSQINKNIHIIKSDFNLSDNHILIPFSSETKKGVLELWSVIENTLQ